MFCSISGTVPEQPVVSKKSGHIFEQRLIEKALLATGGKCPETGEHLTPEDLIKVRLAGSHARPTPSGATSFPGLLSHLQSEWDAVVLESHAVKKVLSKTRQELAHALYQFEAANRVIGELLQERDELRKVLSTHGLENSSRSGLPHKRKSHENEEPNALKDIASIDPPEDAPVPENPVPAETSDALASNNSDPTGVPEPQPKRLKQATVTNNTVNYSLPAELVDEISQAATDLQTRRKERVLPPSLAKADDISRYVENGTIEIRKNPSPVTCLCKIPPNEMSKSKELFAAGSKDGTLSILDAEALEPHWIKEEAHSNVVSIASHEKFLVSGGKDYIVRVWGFGSESEGTLLPMQKIELDSAVGDVAVHAGGRLVLGVTSSAWSWIDVETGSVLCKRDGYVNWCGAAHPDGLIFATGGVGSVVQVWDLRTGGALTQLDGGSQAKVDSLAMSENGFFLMAAGGESVKVWDLRKIKVAKEYSGPAGSIGLALDTSGSFGAAVGGNGHVLFSGKKKGGVLSAVTYNQDMVPSGERLGVAWMHDAKGLLVADKDCRVKRYGPAIVPDAET